MKKNYLWRISLATFCLFVLVTAYITMCDFNLGKCIGGNSIIFTRTFVHFSLSILISSIPLFFVNDQVFKKWLHFALVWFLASALFIFLAPEYSGGWGPSLNPTKELVSIWMSSLFVIISLVKIFVDTKRSKNISI